MTNPLCQKSLGPALTTTASAGPAAPPEDGIHVDCYYLNPVRVAHLLRLPAATPGPYHPAARPNMMTERIHWDVGASDAILAWARHENVPSLAEIILDGKAKEGRFFTAFATFSGAGFAAAAARLEKGHADAQATLRADFDTPTRTHRLEITYNPANCLNNSAGSMLQGRHKLLVIGYIESIEKTTLHAKALLIGTATARPTSSTAKSMFWPSTSSISVEDIDSFSKIRDTRPPGSRGVQSIKSVPEAEIKKAFAEIIGEPYVPKDWGGETSDLFTTRVVVGGQRVATAFVLKGKAFFHPMTLADLGKNGDQLLRLGSEPAELIVVQHCHSITPAIRHFLELICMRPGSRQRFCLIDGADTVRILAAYNKCGFKSDSPVSSAPPK